MRRGSRIVTIMTAHPRLITPGTLSPERQVPASITRPEYVGRADADEGRGGDQYTPEEIERGVAAGARILGVNVRNLKTLDVDPARYAALADGLPEDVVRVAESGVESEEQIKAYAAAGADVVLVGEALVRHGAPEEALRAFRAASLTVR